MSSNDVLQARIKAAHARIDAAEERYNAGGSLDDDAAVEEFEAASDELHRAECALEDAIDASLSPINRLPRALNAQGLFVGIMFPPGESSEAEVVVMRNNWAIAVERDADAEAAMRRAYERATEASGE